MIHDVNRVEKKYQINPITMADLKYRLGLYMKPDSHNGIDGYMVRSIYFDSLYDRDYQDKIDGVDERKKIRLRVYDPDADIVKLEVKQKQGGVQRKQSIDITREQAKALLAGDYGILLDMNIPLAMQIYNHMVMNIYRPKCMVEYDRFAYMLDENNTRITFDSNLRASETCLDLFDRSPLLYPVADATNITLEVKYDGFLFSNVKKAISHKMGPEVSSSKYCRARAISKKTGM